MQSNDQIDASKTDLSLYLTWVFLRALNKIRHKQVSVSLILSNSLLLLFSLLNNQPSLKSVFSIIIKQMRLRSCQQLGWLLRTCPDKRLHWYLRVITGDTYRSRYRSCLGPTAGLVAAVDGGSVQVFVVAAAGEAAVVDGRSYGLVVGQWSAEHVGLTLWLNSPHLRDSFLQCPFDWPLLFDRPLSAHYNDRQVIPGSVFLWKYQIVLLERKK